MSLKVDFPLSDFNQSSFIFVYGIHRYGLDILQILVHNGYKIYSSIYNASIYLQILQNKIQMQKKEIPIYKIKNIKHFIHENLYAFSKDYINSLITGKTCM